MSLTHQTSDDDMVLVLNPDGQSSVVVVCEHASFFIPPELNNLGLTHDALKSHAAWDPGALGVAKSLAENLGAKLVASGVSRLVYDCNRPPTAADAMPIQSEVFDIPGNVGLTPDQRRDRTESYYEPFRAKLAERISATELPAIVTVHSFTPVYHGKQRAVEIGVLHDVDARLADVLLQIAPSYLDANVQRNEPYGPQDGVTHTLKEQAIGAGHLNVMLEIRNDLIVTAQDQDAMAFKIAKWLTDALTRLQAVQGVQ